MHSQPRHELQNLLRRYGPALAGNPQRVEALLSDLCGQHQREIFVLVHTQRSGILVELSRMAGQRAEGALRQRLAQRLQDRYAFSAEAAAWAVDAWADALGVRAVPIYQSWLLVFWHNLRDRASFLFAPKQSSRPPAYPSPAASIRTNSARSLFGRIGVQWKKLSPRSILLIFLAVAVIGTAGIAWQRGWQWDWLAATSSLAVEPQAVAAEEGNQSGPVDAATALALGYAPPLEARIEADLLNVRAAPALDAEVLGKVGPLGASVLVDSFTDDGAWSHIAAPVNGWVSNEFVTFAGATPEQRVYVQFARGQTTETSLPVRSAPRADAPATATLEAGQTLILVAVSADGLWRQVVEPFPGWVESRTISLMER